MRSKIINISSLLAALCAIVLLHAWGIANKALWYDEVTTAVYAGKSLPDLLRFLNAWDVHPPLFFAVEHYFLKLSLPAEWSLRLFPLLCSLLCIPLAEALARRAYNVKWLGGLMTAVFPGLVIYGQEARAYAPLVCLQLAALYSLQRLRERPRENRWVVACTASLWIAAAMNYFAILFLPVLAVALFLIAKKRHVVVIALLFAAIAYLPWLGRVLRTFSSQSEALQGAAPRVITLTDYFNTLAFHFGSQAVAAAMIPLAALAVWRTRSNPITWILVTLALFTPLLLLLAPPRYPYFPPRYLITWAAVLFLLVIPILAVPIKAIQGFNVPAAAAWLLIPALAWPSLTHTLESRVWNRELGEMSSSLFQDGDILVVEPYYQSIAMLYYLPLAPATKAKMLSNPLANYDGLSLTLGDKEIGFTSLFALAPVLSNRGHFDRTLYLLSYGPLSPALSEWKSQFSPVSAWPQATLYRATAPVRFDAKDQQIWLGSLPLGEWKKVSAHGVLTQPAK